MCAISRVDVRSKEERSMSLAVSSFSWLKFDFQLNAVSQSSASSSSSTSTTPATTSSNTSTSATTASSTTQSDGASFGTLGKDLLNFLTDLQSGDLKGAQAALSSLKSDFGLTGQDSDSANGTSTGPSVAHHHRHHSQSSSNATSTTGSTTSASYSLIALSYTSD